MCAFILWMKHEILANNFKIFMFETDGFENNIFEETFGFQNIFRNI